MGGLLKNVKKKSRAERSEQLARRLADLANGRDEMNLCELPFATLSERSSDRSVLRYEIEDFDAGLGQTVLRRLTVTGDPEHGLPTEKDEEIYLALLKYTNDYNGFADPEVRLSRAALFELMGWPKSDWAYARLTKGMHRLVGARLSYHNLWRDNRDKQWRDQGAFGILDSFEFRDSRSVGRHATFREQSSRFRWGSVLFESFDSGYLKRIDYGLTRKLSPQARRLYRYLDKHFHPPRKTLTVVDVARLGYQHIGVSTNVALDKVRKRHIAPAAEELEAAGYLKPAGDSRFRKLRRGVWEAVFELAERATDRQSAPAPVNAIVEQLCRRGVSAEKACALVAGYSTQAVTTACRTFDEQRRQGHTIRGSDGWFTAALQRGFQPSVVEQNTARRPELQVFRAKRRSG